MLQNIITKTENFKTLQNFLNTKINENDSMRMQILSSVNR